MPKERRTWTVHYERIMRGDVTVEAESAEEARAIVERGDFEPDSGEELVDWGSIGSVREDK